MLALPLRLPTWQEKCSARAAKWVMSRGTRARCGGGRRLSWAALAGASIQFNILTDTCPSLTLHDRRANLPA